MPDFNDQFSRFMDQFQRDSRADTRNNEEMVRTLRELLEEQRKMREQAEELARQNSLDRREEEIEDARNRKKDDIHQKKVETGKTKGGDILGELLAIFKSPAVLGAAIGLGFADSLTKVNLGETLFAGTILSKVGGARLLNGMQKVSLSTTRGIAEVGKQLQLQKFGKVKPTTGGKLGAGITSSLKPGAGYDLVDDVGKAAKGPAKGASRGAKTAGGALRGVGAAASGAGTGIFATIRALLKPFMSLLKPVMSVVKLFARASVVLVPVIAIIEGAMKAFEVFQAGGSISEVIMGFLLGALESLTTGLLEGLTTLGEWLLIFVESIPDIIGDMLHGLLDFIGMLFGGEEDTKIGGMLMSFASGLWDAIKGLLGMVIKLAMALLVLPWKLLGKLIGLILPGVGNAISDFFQGIADWVGDLWDWFWSDDEEWEQMKKDKEDARKKKQLEDAKKVAEMQGDTTELDKINAEIEALQTETAETNLDNAEKGKEAAEKNKEAADLNAESAETAKSGAEKTHDEVVGKLKGLGEITKGLMKTYGGAVKSFMADPAAGFAGVNQASARGKKRTYGGFDWAQKLDPFGGERNMFEKTDAAQNVGSNVLHESMGAEMDKRRKDRAASALAVNAPTTVTNTTNAKTHTQVPRGTRHTDRSLDKANRRDRVNM